MNLKIVDPPLPDFGPWDTAAVELNHLSSAAMTYRLDVNDEGEASLALTDNQRENTICIFFVAGFAAIDVEDVPMIPGGLSFFGPGNHARHGTVAVQANNGSLTAAHEVGHILTGKSGDQNTGHYLTPNGVHRRHAAQNLMLRTVLGNDRVAGPKRLWFEDDRHGHGQLVAVRASRFLRPW